MKTNLKPAPKTSMTPSWDLLPKSMKLVTNNFTAIMYLFLFPGLLAVLGQLLIGTHLQTQPHLPLTSNQIVGFVFTGVSVLWTIVNLGPSLYFQLKAIDGKQETIGDYYKHGLPYTLRILGFEIVFGLMVFIGLILLIIPGLIVIRRYLLANYYLVDSNSSITVALQRSKEDTKPRPIGRAVWGALGVTLVFVLIASFVSNIPLIGAILAEFASFPALFLFALRYREIRPKAL